MKSSLTYGERDGAKSSSKNKPNNRNFLIHFRMLDSFTFSQMGLVFLQSPMLFSFFSITPTDYPSLCIANRLSHYLSQNISCTPITTNILQRDKNKMDWSFITKTRDQENILGQPIYLTLFCYHKLWCKIFVKVFCYLPIRILSFSVNHFCVTIFVCSQST